MRRSANGRYARSLSRFTGLLLMIFTISIGLPLYYQDQPIVQQFIVKAQDQSIAQTVPAESSELVAKELGEVPAPTLKLEVEPTPVITPRPGSKQEIFAYIVAKFGDDAADMITIIRKCENSKFNQEATNHNSNGTVDYGIAQINSIHIPRCGNEIKTDWKANIDCAYDIYQRAGNSFRPWTCSTEIGQKNYLNQ